MISIKILSLSFVGLFLGCKSFKNDASKETIAIVDKKELKNENLEVSSSCPENGTCVWSVMPDTNLTLKEDTIGAIYPVFTKQIGIHTIKFEYDKTVEEGLADGGYKEVIYIQIPATTSSVDLKDKTLQEVELTYGRLCFCRGETGYYPITKGSLQLDKTTEGYKIALTFENGQVPQLINNLEGVVVMEEK